MQKFDNNNSNRSSSEEEKHTQGYNPFGIHLPAQNQVSKFFKKIKFVHS